LIIWLKFLSVSPNQTKFFLSVCWSQLDISATLDSVFAVSEGYQLNYCWVLNLLSGPKIFYVFVPSVFGENIPTAEFGMIPTETACWDIERK
jgi:hypothetical protein